MRFVRALWPVLFLVPLSWWADRGCSIAGVDTLYHTTVWIHERLGWFVLLLAAISATTVIVKVARARGRLTRLLGLAEAPPARVQRAFDRASAELSGPVTRIAYLDIPERIASTVIGPVILISRGFAQTLGDDDLVLVARHELLHARRHDARAGVAWHLAFAALLLPGFEPLERRLYASRERATNFVAAEGREDAYLALLARAVGGPMLCTGMGIGLEATARGNGTRSPLWLAPAILILLAVLLPLSHLEFTHDLPFLLKHHC